MHTHHLFIIVNKTCKTYKKQCICCFSRPMSNAKQAKVRVKFFKLQRNRQQQLSDKRHGLFCFYYFVNIFAFSTDNHAKFISIFENINRISYSETFDGRKMIDRASMSRSQSNCFSSCRNRMFQCMRFGWWHIDNFETIYFAFISNRFVKLFNSDRMLRL